MTHSRTRSSVSEIVLAEDSQEEMQPRGSLAACCSNQRPKVNCFWANPTEPIGNGKKYLCRPFSDVASLFTRPGSSASNHKGRQGDFLPFPMGAVGFAQKLFFFWTLSPTTCGQALSWLYIFLGVLNECH